MFELIMRHLYFSTIKKQTNIVMKQNILRRTMEIYLKCINIWLLMRIENLKRVLIQKAHVLTSKMNNEPTACWLIAVGNITSYCILSRMLERDCGEWGFCSKARNLWKFLCIFFSQVYPQVLYVWTLWAVFMFEIHFRRTEFSI